MPILEIITIFVPAIVPAIKIYRFMRLKKKYFNALSDLSNWSMEICLESSIFGQHGVSEKDFQRFLYAYLKFLRLFPKNPRDLLTKD